MASFNARQVKVNDWGVMGAGAVAFVVSFFPYYGASAAGLGGVSVNAWHGWALVGMLFVLAAAVLVAIRVFGGTPLPTLPVGWALVVTAVSVLGALMIFLRSVTLPSGSGLGIDYGIRFGGWLLIIVAIAQVVFAVRAFLESGERVVWAGRPKPQPPVGQPPVG